MQQPENEQPWVPISTGALLGGGGIPKALSDGLQRLSKCVCKARDGLPAFDEMNAAGVNVVFHVGGDVLKPEFGGMRTGSWIGKRRTQVVQVAVPADLRETEPITAYLATSLENAVAVGVERLSHFKRSSNLTTSQASSAAEVAAKGMRITASN